MSNKFNFRPILSLIALLALIFSSCSDSNPDCNCDESVTGTIVTDTPTQIFSFTEAEQLQVGTTLFIRVNRSKDVVLQYPVTFEGIYDYQGEHLIFCRSASNLIIGQGDSGSPILTADGKVVAALCYGFSSNNHQFAARAIEDLTDIAKSTKLAKATEGGTSSQFEAFGAVNFVCGFNSELFERYTKNAPDGMFNQYDKFFTSDHISHAGLKSAQSNTVIPGQSIGVMEVTGDLLSMGSMGTCSYVDGNKLFAYGHDADIDYSPLALPVVKVNMVVMLELNVYSSYKIALPTNDNIGSLVKTAHEGILIDKTTQPKTFDLTTSIKIDNETYNDKHNIAQFEDAIREHYHARYLPGTLVYFHLSDYDYQYVHAQGSVTINYETQSITIPIDIEDYADYIDSRIAYKLGKEMPYNDEHIQSQSMTLTVAEHIPSF